MTPLELLITAAAASVSTALVAAAPEKLVGGTLSPWKEAAASASTAPASAAKAKLVGGTFTPRQEALRDVLQFQKVYQEYSEKTCSPKDYAGCVESSGDEEKEEEEEEVHKFTLAPPEEGVDLEESIGNS
jgi:hypothetical protein